MDPILTTLQQTGFVHHAGLLTPKEVAAARKAFAKYYPSPDELRATPKRYEGILDNIDNLKHEFPFEDQSLNELATGPRVTQLVESLLGTDDLRLSQAAIWAKYAGFGETYEQEHHADYEGNTLVVPRDDGDYRQVNLILYLTDVTPELGPTCLVPLKVSEKNPIWPPWRPREKWASYYRNEVPILAKAGDLLIFGMRVFHRAAPIVAETGWRLTMHLVYRAARHDFQGYHRYSQQGENPLLSQFIQSTTERQRRLLGFPKPGDAYWTNETLTAVKLRYPRLDWREYER